MEDSSQPSSSTPSSSSDKKRKSPDEYKEYSPTSRLLLRDSYRELMMDKAMKEKEQKRQKRAVRNNQVIETDTQKLKMKSFVIKAALDIVLKKNELNGRLPYGYMNTVLQRHARVAALEFKESDDSISSFLNRDAVMYQVKTMQKRIQTTKKKPTPWSP
jgi:hypothetical protein